MSNRVNQKVLLMVLDGFGIGKDSPYNSIQNAKMPFFRRLLSHYPHSQLLTHGRAVGLPDGIMGNSEVGHMTMGAGRTIYQDLTRISKSIEDKEFQKNPELLAAIRTGAQSTGRVHLMGLFSDGGVHSHLDHLYALIDLCLQEGVPKICLHLFLDGRDTPPDSSPRYLKDLYSYFSRLEPNQAERIKVATISGRYWAMDRDNRWERIERAVQALTGKLPQTETSVLDTILNAHNAHHLSDEFIEPAIFDKSCAIQEGDSLLFFNYRSDRARQISQVFTGMLQDRGFQDIPHLSSYLGFTEYDTKLQMKVAFGPQNLTNIFGEWLEKHSLSQFRIAETEKYAHVTFFFNGGREAPFQKETRVLVPSPKEVATYDLKPEMSAFAIAEELEKQIRSEQFHFSLVNFANADMVGHTGNYSAAVQAMEALDQCIEKVVGAAEQSHTHVLICSDHGNAEEMVDAQGRKHTQHTLNPVPAIWVSPNSAISPRREKVALRDGSLCDIMPTLCQLMGLDIPPEVTGKSLLPSSEGFKV